MDTRRPLRALTLLLLIVLELFLCGLWIASENRMKWGRIPGLRAQDGRVQVDRGLFQVVERSNSVLKPIVSLPMWMLCAGVGSACVILAIKRQMEIRRGMAECDLRGSKGIVLSNDQIQGEDSKTTTWFLPILLGMWIVNEIALELIAYQIFGSIDRLWVAALTALAAALTWLELEISHRVKRPRESSIGHPRIAIVVCAFIFLTSLYYKFNGGRDERRIDPDDAPPKYEVPWNVQYERQHPIPKEFFSPDFLERAKAMTRPSPR